jgi:hypothetical protein
MLLLWTTLAVTDDGVGSVQDVNGNTVPNVAPIALDKSSGDINFFSVFVFNVFIVISSFSLISFILKLKLNQYYPLVDYRYVVED